jgi:2,3-bisphosphoglycerate-independent phosphoglycerate mutase
MNIQKIMKQISHATNSKIVLAILDGLGGLPHPDLGKTELETAFTPNLDALTGSGITGLVHPIAPGITPGSAPGHLAIFGYDPVEYTIGRGALEALGIDFKLEDDDVAIRGNFCNVTEGKIVDRRAERITTQKNAELCKLLDNTVIDGVRIIVKPVKEHRLVVILRGSNLSDNITDTDPQRAEVSPLEAKSENPEAEKTAKVVNTFIAMAKELLAKQHPANMILLRGSSHRPSFHSMNDIYKLKAAAIASYPMYRGLARTIGMEVLDTGPDFAAEVATLQKHFAQFDFFFIHYKVTDSAGEDGDFKQKVQALETFDQLLPHILNLNSDVVAITGDHSTPSILKSHSWHPVPLVISSGYCFPDSVTKLSETNCLQGGLGQIPANSIMPLLMANALKLDKFGA